MPPHDTDEEVEAWRIERLAARRSSLGEDDEDGLPIESIQIPSETIRGASLCARWLC